MHPAALTEGELYKAAQTVLVQEPDWGHGLVAQAQLRKALWWVVEEIRSYQSTCEEGNPGYLQAGVIATMVLEDAFKRAGIEPWPTRN